MAFINSRKCELERKRRAVRHIQPWRKGGRGWKATAHRLVSLLAIQQSANYENLPQCIFSQRECCNCCEEVFKGLTVGIGNGIIA